MRDAYAAHVARMFQLMGDGAADAQREAGVVMSIETALAKGSLTRVEQRDPRKLYHKADERALQALTPAFDWKPYLAALGIAGNDRFNVTEPKFYRTLDVQVRTHSLADLKTYLRWHVAHVSAPFLSTAFVDENFGYFSKTLRGVPELSPRWRRCVALVDAQIGEALGQEFVKLTFGPELKAKTQHMTLQIEAAMESEIKGLDWMSAPTKAKALEKLHGIVNKIGYPDKWRDYSSLVIKRDDLLGNVERGDEFELRRELAKIGKPVDRGEWGMTPPTVNAYYDPQMNDINFPAGVLQPPLFDAKLDDAPNYGNTGGTIGHELTHGFDDEGRQYDATGNLKNWWTKKDADEFNKRTQCLVDQYGKYVVVDDIHINSKLTLGEDLADFGGLVLAIIAWKAEMAANPPPPLKDGFTPDQRFFIGMAQWACANERPEQLRVLAVTDPHSPTQYRVNGLVSNFKEFEKAFACKPGQPMAPVDRCHVW
jgi:endothelin-converting enzyme/putative endopeptidase